MQENINKLLSEFERIKEMGWIKEKRKGLGGCGYTLETLLKKEEDNFPWPDYNNIEIKTMNQKTKNNLHLFNLIPDGDYLFPIKRVLDELGYQRQDNNFKTFYHGFNAKEFSRISFGKKGKIVVNRKMKKIELLVINNRLENLNIGVSWSFSYLKERLECKLKYLAFVRASSHLICGEGYFRYDQITIYKLKDFDIFLSLIENGIVEITFKIGVYKSGDKIGQVYDHGTDFSIKVSDIELLYSKIC